MNTTIMAERQAKAVQAIAEAVTRLGGTFTAPTGRVPNPATKHVLYLEALVEALDGIGVQPLFEPSAPVAETQPVEDVQPKAAPPAPRKMTPKGKAWDMDGRELTP